MATAPGGAYAPAMTVGLHPGVSRSLAHLAGRVLLGGALAAALLGGCGPGNQEACRQYVEQANREYLLCGYDHLILDENGTCPAWLDLGGADCTAHYDCLEQHTECCTPARKAAMEAEGETCAEWEIDFPALEGCGGCE